MIRVTLKNGHVLLFNNWERLTTVEWISDDAEYWSGEYRCRVDELLRVVEKRPNQDRYVIERIDADGDAIVEKDWISPIASVRKFTPAEFV